MLLFVPSCVFTALSTAPFYSAHLLPCVNTWKAQVCDKQGSLLTFQTASLCPPPSRCFSPQSSLNVKLTDLSCNYKHMFVFRSDQNTLFWIWFCLQLLQRRSCVISAERHSPQRTLWKPTGKHTQVLYKHVCMLSQRARTHTHTQCLTWTACTELLSKPWLRDSWSWSKLACHAGWVKLFLSWCSIIYQQGGGRPSHISPTNISWHPGPLHATLPQQ